MADEQAPGAAEVDEINAVLADLEAAVEGIVKLREENATLRANVGAILGKVRAVVGRWRGQSAPSSAQSAPPQA